MNRPYIICHMVTSLDGKVWYNKKQEIIQGVDLCSENFHEKSNK